METPTFSGLKLVQVHCAPTSISEHLFSDSWYSHNPYLRVLVAKKFHKIPRNQTKIKRTRPKDREKNPET